MKKVQELEKQLENSTARFEEKLKADKAAWGVETAERIQSLVDEKALLESKFSGLKKQSKESESTAYKKLNELEKEKAIGQEKLTFLEGRLKEAEYRFVAETEQLKEQLGKSRDITGAEKKGFISEIEKLKSASLILDNERHELTTSYERDKVLWEGKFAFL